MDLREQLYNYQDPNAKPVRRKESTSIFMMKYRGIDIFTSEGLNHGTVIIQKYPYIINHYTGDHYTGDPHIKGLICTEISSITVDVWISVDDIIRFIDNKIFKLQNATYSI